MKLSRSSVGALVVLMVLCLVPCVRPAPGHYIHEYYRKQEESQYYGGDRSARAAIHSGGSTSTHHHHDLSLALLTIVYLLLW